MWSGLGSHCDLKDLILPSSLSEEPQLQLFPNHKLLPQKRSTSERKSITVINSVCSV